jgi:hypothetical protein
MKLKRPFNIYNPRDVVRHAMRLSHVGEDAFTGVMSKAHKVHNTSFLCPEMCVRHEFKAINPETLLTPVGCISTNFLCTSSCHLVHSIT